MQLLPEADLKPARLPKVGKGKGLKFAKNKKQTPAILSENPWKIAIIDDEPEIHNVTKLALSQMTFAKRPLTFLHAYSAAEGRVLLEDNPDIAAVLLDVVMESDNAGLQLVAFIRETLNYKSIRIILRTGQPGQAPEHSVIREFDINDYKQKSELTVDRLQTSMFTALRSYRDMRALEMTKIGLKNVIEASASIFSMRSLDQFTRGVLEQLTSMLFLDPSAVYGQADAIAATSIADRFDIIAGTGQFESFVGKDGSDLLDPVTINAIQAALDKRSTYVLEGKLYVAYFQTVSGVDHILCVKGDLRKDCQSNELIDLFCRNVAIAFENVHLEKDLRSEIHVRRKAEYKAEALARLSEESPDPILRISDHGEVHYANRPAQILLDHWTMKVGQTLPKDWSARVRTSLETQAVDHLELSCDEKIFDITLSPVPEAGYVNMYGRDVTSNRKAQERIAFMAHHDSLTGLANRVAFQKALERNLKAASHKDEKLALLQIDLDFFKEVNDTFGHHVGDKLLCEIARRLKAVVRPTDSLARLGGDEFAIIMPHLAHSGNASHLAQDIITQIGQTVDLEGTQTQIGCSIGITIWPDDAAEPDSLLKNADLAMYQAKAEGRNCYHFYDATLHEKVQKERFIGNELRYALERNELSLHYQPKISLRTRKVIGAEALLRWKHPACGWIPPGDFIEIAERTGQICEIGEWVLQKACRDIKQMQLAGLDIGHIAVNLSAAQFRNQNIVSVVKQALADSQLAPETLELEITESVMMDDVEGTITTLNALKSLGVHLSVDDFGTGYSSLCYLRQFPITKMKIDRSFITDILTNPDACAITDAIISLGKSLHLSLVAEGIEEDQQAECLMEKGYEEGQGFLFSRPVPLDELKEKLMAA